MSEPRPTTLIGLLRAEIARLPDGDGVLIEDDLGWRYEITTAYAIGTSTDDPGLVIRIRREYQ